jgi:hypothetical protein
LWEVMLRIVGMKLVSMEMILHQLLKN